MSWILFRLISVFLLQRQGLSPLFPGVTNRNHLTGTSFYDVTFSGAAINVKNISAMDAACYH